MNVLINDQMYGSIQTSMVSKNGWVKGIYSSEVWHHVQCAARNVRFREFAISYLPIP